MRRFTGLLIALLLCAPAELASAAPRASTFTLSNGLQVVVIPDHRVGIVTHMIWYRAGGADDPWGTSGIAHFLEHLMFKSTSKLKSGEFTRTITKLGGRDNAKTTHDATYYYQRVAKENLRSLMALEAERMAHLKLIDGEVRTERDVIREERRSTVEANPLSVLSEQMLAALYTNHPYGRPVLGWAHEMEALSRKDAATFYRQFYAPNNAVLVVAGDITPEEVRPLAEATYGANRPNPAVKRRLRPQEPEPVAARRVVLEDARAGSPMLVRFYHVPSYTSGPKGDAEALEVLAHVIGGDDTSRLYRHFVDGGLAATAAATYLGNGLDGGRLVFIVIPLPQHSLESAEAALDGIIDGVLQKGLLQDEVVRAKSSLQARDVFEADNQMTLAQRYGEGLALGRSVADIDAVPGRVQAVSQDAIANVAKAYLVAKRSVTGLLRKPGAGGGQEAPRQQSSSR